MIGFLPFTPLRSITENLFVKFTFVTPFFDTLLIISVINKDDDFIIVIQD